MWSGLVLLKVKGGWFELLAGKWVEGERATWDTKMPTTPLDNSWMGIG